MQVFCDETASALKTSKEVDDVDGTVIFMTQIIQFWKIVNCHGLYRKKRLRDPCRAAIRSALDDNLVKLVSIAELAEQLTPKQKRDKKLSRDTSKNLSHTCRGLVALAPTYSKETIMSM